jgi:phage terminase large subunit-like protein
MLLPMLRPDQLSIAKHPAKKKYLMCGRRWGKSVLGGVIAANVLRQHGAVAWISPTYKNSRPLWRWITRVTRPHPNWFLISEADRTIQTHMGGFLALFSADNIDAIRGEKFHVAIIDEGARVTQEAVQEAIEPTLADYDGDELVISTPKGINWFSEEFDKAALLMNEDMAAWRAPSSGNPIPGIQKAYEKARLMLPPRIFAQEWDALPTAAGGQVFDRAWFSPRWQPGVRDPVGRYISLDTAMKEKESNDLTAWSVGEITVDYHMNLIDVGEERVAFPALLDTIVKVASHHNVDGKLNAVIIEDVGSGTSALQALRANAPDWLKPLLVEFRPKGDKIARANHAAIWCKTSCVRLPEVGVVVWLFPFERQLFSFPDVVHDDVTDSFTQLIIYCENILQQGLDSRSV